MKPGKHQRSKQRCQDFGWKVHDRVQSFVLSSYTMHELRNWNGFYWLVSQSEVHNSFGYARSRSMERKKKHAIKNFVITPNSNTFSDWRKACHVPWVKTPLLSTQRNNSMNFRLARDQVVPPVTAANEPAGVKQKISLLFFWFWVGRYKKHLMTGPSGNSEFCFLATLNEGPALGNKTRCFPWGQPLKGHCHQDFAVLGQFCAKIITVRL